ncbi:MAG: BMP family ABC transporter substrate-binding protein [Eubacterium sp.]|nr:BMP family ABC transporter substrate-binding protein [Eubacterium sp.]
MKKAVSIILCAVLLAVSIFAFSGCTPAEKLSYDVVLITDGGTVTDKSYNQSAWSGVLDFANEAGLTSRYYQPVLENGVLTLESALSYIDLSVKSGAKYIVLPTDVFEVAAYEGAQKYADVSFLLLDGTPKNQDGEAAALDNLMSVTFNGLQSGFLAGYNAVISGHQKLGYFGADNDGSRNYGAGYIQGAAYAADKFGIPVVMDYADFDSPSLDYDYSFTITANYKKIEDVKEKTFKINVVNGIGSGVYTEGSNVTLIADPAPEGKVFDKWETKSDTEGVRDSKVNLSTKTKTTSNLLVEKCDATITAVYKDADYPTAPVIIMNADNTEVYSTQYHDAGGRCEIIAPVAPSGMVFDHWEDLQTYKDVESAIYGGFPNGIDDVNAKDTWIDVGKLGRTLLPVYVKSAVPTFNVTVVTGEGGDGESTGSGAYITGDKVSLSAALPKDGYIFYNWSNVDNYGYGAGVSMDNEYYPETSFTMVNRYQSVVETMYDEGVSVIYAGGNKEGDVVGAAVWNYSFNVYGIGSELSQAGWHNYFSSSVKDFAAAVKYCLKDFKGGMQIVGDCSNGCITMSYVAEDNAESYNEVYAALADGSINLKSVKAGDDVSAVLNSKCLTLDYWVVEK